MGLKDFRNRHGEGVGISFARRARQVSLQGLAVGGVPAVACRGGLGRRGDGSPESWGAGGILRWSTRFIKIYLRPGEPYRPSRGTLQITGFQPGLLGQHLHGCGPKRHTIMVGKQHIRPSGTLQNSMGGSALPLDPPPNPQQSGQGLSRLG